MCTGASGGCQVAAAAVLPAQRGGQGVRAKVQPMPERLQQKQCVSHGGSRGAQEAFKIAFPAHLGALGACRAVRFSHPACRAMLVTCRGDDGASHWGLGGKLPASLVLPVLT